MSTLETTQDDETWSTWLEEAGVDDVYCTARYARIWAREERGSFVGARFESSAGRILYSFIVVPLDGLPGGLGIFEARTPYDFGGPRADGDDLGALHREFREALLDWFRKHHVVSEFARIHPLSGGGHAVDAQLHASNFIVDLTLPYDDLFSSQHRRHRRAVRAFSRQHGLSEIISDISPADTSSFAELYALTMDRVGAGADYYFSEEALSDLMSLDEMILVRAEVELQTKGAALFLRSGRDLFYFLGASANERPSGTNNAIFDAAIRQAQSEGLKTLHLGGGGGSLREFKSQIASGTVPYYLLQRIVDPSSYRDLCEACGASSSAQFPAFRSMLVEQRRS